MQHFRDPSKLKLNEGLELKYFYWTRALQNSILTQNSILSIFFKKTDERVDQGLSIYSTLSGKNRKKNDP